MSILRRVLLLLILAFGPFLDAGEFTETYSEKSVSTSLPKAPDFYLLPDAAQRPDARPAHARPSIVLLIGDGMGFNHIAVARRAAGGLNARLTLDRLPVAGVVLTHSANDAVTDSAAAGTALSSGVKTRNGAIGVTPDGTDQLTLLEGLRRKHGYRTGLVVTKNVTDATPAAFVAEVDSRKSEEEIAGQLLAEQVDVVFGGGRALFQAQTAGGKRVDGKDLLAQLRASGTAVAEDKAGLAAIARLPAYGLFAPGVLDSTDPTQPTLAEMTRKALALLSAEGKPFFLMVEGSQIDSAGHKNDAAYLVRELLHFDLAVREACAFAANRPDVLIVVTADHETGGLTVFGEKLIWSSGQHSGAPVPVFACGAGATEFGGVMDNTEIARRLAALAHLAPFPSKE